MKSINIVKVEGTIKEIGKISTDVGTRIRVLVDTGNNNIEVLAYAYPYYNKQFLKLAKVGDYIQTYGIRESSNKVNKAHTFIIKNKGGN